MVLSPHLLGCHVWETNGKKLSPGWANSLLQRSALYPSGNSGGFDSHQIVAPSPASLSASLLAGSLRLLYLAQAKQEEGCHLAPPSLSHQLLLKLGVS